MANGNRQAILKEKIAALPKTPGVYMFKDAEGRVMYIGKANDLRARVASYFQPAADLHSTRGPAIAEMATRVVDIAHLDCENEVEALLTENRLIKDVQPPYNERLTDGKSFPYIEITTWEDFPRVRITREPHAKSKLFGPFVNVSGLRAAMRELQRIFKFCTCTLKFTEEDLQRRRHRPCLLYSIHHCTAPCAGRIDRQAYREDIQRLIKFLSSKRSVVLRQMRKDMEQASADMKFELAAKLRDQIRALESLDLAGKPDVHIQPEVFFTDPKEGLERLARILDLDGPPRVIEGFDIATIQGEDSCGSLVCFIDGVPFKDGYKRFRIKTVEGMDDYAMLREVLFRRYRHVAQGEELFPDLVLIDGGLGQLHAAREAIAALDLDPPRIISLAKREEEIYVDRTEQPVKLPRNDPALKILQYVRDEAHRFAQHYHHILRRKKVIGE
ncbi:MAG: excinuclease ABC subunit UvrC [Phycisphaerae bacterium]|nr:excinuclease ABC subunit UvrC [Phycisphaerae bacterium]